MATDCSDGDYLGAYRRFFEDFVAQVDPDDQLPVKVSSYDLTEAEISGEIIDWTLQYLNQKYCPPSLQSYLVHLVMEEVKLLCSKQPEACGWRFQENTFAPLRLMHVVTGKVNEICLRYLDNSRLALLPPPPSSPIPLVSRCAIKNTRRKMEDRHVVIHDLHALFNVQDDSTANYYAVFDGHAGQDAAVYCAAHLHQYLAESIHYPTDPERALRDAFLTTDAHFIEKSNKQNLNSGTTAVCTLLLKRKLYVAWVGDSQAVLAKRGQITQLVNPHKPDRDDERERVNEMGGAVIHWGIWRVNGQLAVSRAIGDVQYKPYVTGDPDIRCIPLDGTEDFLIVACDGLWDFVSEAMATTLVYQQLREDPRDLEAVSQRLVYFAKSQGSPDNISTIVVFLTNPRQIAARHPSSHPLLADVQLDNMESTNPFLSNANGLQFETNPFGKQQQQTNGTCAENEENLRCGSHFDAPSNGKHANGVEYGNAAETPGNNDGEDDDEDDDDDDEDDDDDDLGPETDVDAVDEGLESSPPTENLSHELFPEKRIDEGNLNPGGDPAPAKDQEPDQHALIPEADNVADSEDSEDEWNYYPNKEKERTTATEAGERKNDKVTTGAKSADQGLDELSETQLTEAEGLGAGESHVEKELEQPELIEADVCAESKLEEQSEDMDFQLNPNAAEFVPVSPPKVLSARPNLNDDFPLSGSPQKQTPEMDDIPIPSQREFQVEVSLRPHDMENSSNGEPTKEESLPQQSEFTDYLMDRQKGGNLQAALGLDESEISSTKAEFGDESNLSFVTATDFQRTGISAVDDSFTGSERGDYDISRDPMAMSLTPEDFKTVFDKECDLNAVHQLNDSDLTGEEENNAAEHPVDEGSPITPEDFGTVSDKECHLNAVERPVDEGSSLTPEAFETVFDKERDVNDQPQPGESGTESVPTAFCTVSGETGIFVGPLGNDVELLPEVASSPTPKEEIVARNISASPQIPLSPSPCGELEPAPISEANDEPVPVSIGNASEVADLVSFASTEQEGRPESLAAPLPASDAAVQEDAHEVRSSPIVDSELEAAKLVEDILVTTPPASQNQSHFGEELNVSPDEQFKLVLEQSNVNESPQTIEEQEPSKESKYELAEEVVAIKTVEESAENKAISDTAAYPSFGTSDFVSNDLIASPSPLSGELSSDKAQIENFGVVVEMESRKEIDLLEGASIAPREETPEGESKTLEMLVNEEPLIDAPVMNLSESMQEFTGLEQQLNPESRVAPLSNEISTDVEKLEHQSSAIIEPAIDLIDEKIVAKAEENEKIPETTGEVVASSIAATAAVAAVVAAGAAATTTPSSGAKTTTKAKTAAKTTPRTAATMKTTNKSMPTSPTKGAGLTQRTSGATVPKKPATATTASRPRQLETAKAPIAGTTNKVPAGPKSAVTATTKTTSLSSKASAPRTGTSAPAKPRTTSSAPKSTSASADKKPTTNGDAKAPTKPIAPKSSTVRAPSGTGSAASKTLANKTSTTARSAPASAAPTSRPRIAPITAAAKTKPTAIGATGPNTPSPRAKTATATGTGVSKPRFSMTKSPVTDKQTKETTNKQLSSARTSASTLPKSGGRLATTTGPGTATTAKRALAGKNSSTATAGAQPQKKQAPITRPGGKLSSKTATKTTVTSTTKNEVTQNGVSEVHDETSTAITTKTVEEEDVPQKDVSPVASSTDNQLIMTAD